MKFFKRPWLPTTLPALVVWYTNFVMKLNDFAVELGILPAVVQQIADDRDTVQWLANAQEVYEATGGGLRGFRDNTLFGEKGDADPVVPAFTMPAQPAQFQTRIIERLIDLVEDIQDSDNYSVENIGVPLGIVVPHTDPISPDDWTTTLKGKVLPDMKLEIDWLMGEADGVNLQIQYGEENTWENLGNFPKRPAILTITPRTPNTPQAVKIRGRLLDGNTPVGQYSPEIKLIAAP